MKTEFIGRFTAYGTFDARGLPVTLYEEKAMKDGVHVFWLRDEQRKPVACVASEKLPDGTLKFAVATHNPHDKFNRTTGMNKAKGRLKAVHNPHHKTVPMVEGVSPRNAVLSAIAADPKFGISAVKAATYQLTQP